MVAPLLPQAVHRARCRSTSLGAAPADDGDRARQRCVMLAVLEVQPQPRRGAVQVDDTRSIQDYLGHKDIRHTVRYTELSPKPFRDFWRD
jgi:hypothetical protein